MDATQPMPTTLWDGNVAGMREEKNGQNGWSNLSDHPDTSYYLQDELGSPIRLLDEEGNICYVAAYLRYQTDIWEKEYPEITEDVAVLGTLYNLGHEKRGESILGYIFGFGNAPRTPHSNPETNSFGNDVEAYYDLIGKLLESECVE